MYSTNIGNARIQGMEKDLGLKGCMFNWALSIFYIACKQPSVAV
jgi:hypothetical protein